MRNRYFILTAAFIILLILHISAQDSQENSKPLTSDSQVVEVTGKDSLSDSSLVLNDSLKSIDSLSSMDTINTLEDTTKIDNVSEKSISEKMGLFIAELKYFDVAIYFFQIVVLFMGIGISIFYLSLFSNKKYISDIKELIHTSSIKEAGADIYQLIDFEIENLRDKYSFIDFLTSASPLSGLLGTVVGLVKVFKSQAYVGTVSMKTLSGGMYVAMVTTATGLTVAIIGMIFGHILDNKTALIRLNLSESLLAESDTREKAKQEKSEKVNEKDEKNEKEK